MALRRFLFATCLFAASSNRDVYQNWEKYLNKHEVSEHVPSWKNYENWNQWVTEESPRNLAPSKEGVDSWRKWSIAKSSRDGDWSKYVDSYGEAGNKGDWSKYEKMGHDAERAYGPEPSKYGGFTLVSKPKENENENWRSYIPNEYRDHVPSDEQLEKWHEKNKLREEQRKEAAKEREEEARERKEAVKERKEEAEQKMEEAKERRIQRQKEKESQKQGAIANGKEDQKEVEKKLATNAQSVPNNPNPPENETIWRGAEENNKESNGSPTPKPPKKHRLSHPHAAEPAENDLANTVTADEQPREGSNLANVHLSTFGGWSTIFITLIILTSFVGLFISSKLFKGFKKRHYEYEEVRELDSDQLLFI